MTTLRNILFGILPRATTFQVISITQWLTSKKCLAKKAMHFSRNRSLEINQSVKDYQNAPDNIFRGRPDNNYYEAYRPHNLTVMHQRKLRSNHK
jgi:hypothetical protein